jgi:hypothetical protein
MTYLLEVIAHLLLRISPHLCENEMCHTGLAFKSPTQREYL